MNNLKFRQFANAGLVILVLLTVDTLTGGREYHRSQTNAPSIVSVAIPNYSPVALHSHTSGEVVIEMTVNSRGAVTSTKAISGNEILIALSKKVAKRWRFEPTNEMLPRTARVTFSFRLLPRSSPIEELLPTVSFKPSYRVDIPHVFPDEAALP